jgi:radical SAM superfamily enzyme YgiQ (UPF0313 family)
MDTVLLVNLPRQEAERPPAVIAGLAGICKNAGVNYDIFDLNLIAIKNLSADKWRDLQSYVSYYLDNYDANEFIELVHTVLPKNNYSIIAVSMFTYETLRAGNIVLPILRKAYPDSKIVIGGHGADFLDPDNNKQPFYIKHIADNNIDAYILGEAEISFHDYIKNSSRWINSNHRYVVENLNLIPFACYDKIPPDNYLHHGVRGAYITGSRGCVRDCTFCDVGHIWGKFRFRTAQHIFEEILHHHLNYNVTLIEFTDNLINGSLTEFKKLNQLLVAAQDQYPSLKQLRYKGDFICRPMNQFTEKDFHLMKQAGCEDLIVGIESFSESVRYHMGKKFSNKDIDFHLYASGKYGIKNTFLMQVGYPTETLEDHEANKQGLHRYQKYALSRVIKMIRWGCTTGILPGSPLDVNYRHSLPLVFEIENPEFYGESNWINLSNPTLTYAERIRRRMELHFLSKQLRYSQPRVNDEFLFISTHLKNNIKSKKIIQIQI